MEMVAKVYSCSPKDENFNSILEMFFSQNKEPLMIQEYLKDVRDGDKKIILPKNEPVGTINRIPKKVKVDQTFMLVNQNTVNKEIDLYVMRSQIH